LTRSVWRNDFKLVTLLLGMGCRVNYSGPRGISPLMWAGKRGHLEMAKFLIENGADLLEKSSDKDGKILNILGIDCLNIWIHCA